MFFPRKYTEGSVVVRNHCTDQPTVHRIDDGTKNVDPVLKPNV